MENQASVFKKNDAVKFVLAILTPIVLLSFTGAMGFLLIPLIILVVSFYVVILASRRIISENNTAGRAVFVVFFGMLIAAVLIALLWHPSSI